MPTNNSWNNTINGSNTAITLNSGTSALAISTDASATTVSVGTGAAVKTVTVGSTNGASVTTVDCGTGGASFGTTANAHTTTLGSTNSTSATTVQSGSGALNVTATGGALTINSGTGALAISNDASATTVTIATGGAVKTTTLGSTNSTSATTVQSGSGALAVTSTNGTLTINSGTGVLALSNDASATTVNLGTGAAAKTVTLGSTNTTSTTNLQAGSGGIKIPAFAEGALVTSSAGVISTVTGTAGYVLTANTAGTAPSFQQLGGASGVQTVQRVLTNTEIKNLVATPITIISAPGSGKFIRIINGIGKLNYGGNNAFTNPSNSNLQLQYEGGIIQAVNNILANTQVTATSNQIESNNPSIVSQAASAVENQGIKAANTGASDFAGNAANDNTITVFITYQVLTL